MIRIFMQQDWDMEKIADALKTDIAWIRQVNNLFLTEPHLSDREIVERLAKKKKDNPM